MSKICDYIVGMEEEGKLVYRNDRKEYVPVGLSPRSDVIKYRKQRKKQRRK